MSTIATTAPTVPAASEPTVSAPNPLQVPAATEAVPSSNVDDATYMMNTFSTLLEGDLYDDELNGMLCREWLVGFKRVISNL